jgi:predicted Zn-dependent peptidase
MLDRTTAPPFNRTTSLQLIQPHKEILKGGAETYFILGGTQEVSKIEIIFPAGRWFEKKWGAAYFTGNLLSKGTRQKSSYQIAHLLDLYGAHLDIQPGLDYVSVSLYMLNKNFEAAILLLHELLTESVLPETELDLLKSIYLQNLKINYEKTSFLASRMFRRNLFGENHPYGREVEESDLESITKDVVAAHYREQFGKATLFVSGKVSERNMQLVTKTFASFGMNVVNPNNFDNNGRAHTRHVTHKEGSVQSSIRIGKKFISRLHQDYPDTLFLNHILGGYFGSRLMKNIREEKGLSYGISSSLHAFKNDSYLVIGADVNRENLDISFSEIGNELKRLRTEKVDDEELNVARNHFIGSLQLEITTSFAHADKIKNIVLFNLAGDHYQKMIDRVEALDAEDILRTANLYFVEDSFLEIAIG